MEKVIYFIMAICYIEYLALTKETEPELAAYMSWEQETVPPKERRENAECVVNQVHTKAPSYVCNRVTEG